MSSIKTVLMNEARNKKKETKYYARKRMLDMVRSRSELVMPHLVRNQYQNLRK